MRLYHGSTDIVAHPDVTKSRPNLDFGQGFYLTSYEEQAENWAKRKAFLENTVGFVNEYELAENLSGLSILRFSDADADWVEFVCDCRRGGDRWKDYDLIIGGVANDKVYYAVDMYFQGLWGIEQTLDALRFYKVNDQWCFVSQKTLDERLRYIGHREVANG